MTTVDDDGFRPDWASPPGDTIRAIIERRMITVDALAASTGRTPAAVNELISGMTALTERDARALSRVLGGSTEFWSRRERQYRYDLEQIRCEQSEWLTSLPVEDMLRFGWIRVGTMMQCLGFFEVHSVRAWRRSYDFSILPVALRRSLSFDSDSSAVAAWMRQGEIQSASINCLPFDRSTFVGTFSKIRALTKIKDPLRFLPQLTSICANAGVAVVIVRAPGKCRVSGACRMLTRDRALLQLSFRHLADDQFWFTFFHEAAHLVSGRELIAHVDLLEEDRSEEEQAANEFAATVLIPKEFHDEFWRLRLDTSSVLRFASKIGVSPGIVVGQLQHKKRIGFDQLNGLKRRFRWDSEQEPIL